MALLLERFNIRAVRGSAKRRGAGAVRELAGWLRRGHDIGITPDGSRGPCYEIKPGLVLLAQLSGCAILPMSFEFPGPGGCGVGIGSSSRTGCGRNAPTAAGGSTD